MTPAENAVIEAARKGRMTLRGAAWRLRAYAGIALIVGGVLVCEALDALNWPGARKR